MVKVSRKFENKVRCRLLTNNNTCWMNLQIFTLLVSIWNITLILKSTTTQCLKITKKVAFNNASEASFVYILSGQKFIKNAKNGPFWRVFKIHA